MKKVTVHFNEQNGIRALQLVLKNVLWQNATGWLYVCAATEQVENISMGLALCKLPGFPGARLGPGLPCKTNIFSTENVSFYYWHFATYGYCKLSQADVVVSV